MVHGNIIVKVITKYVYTVNDYDTQKTSTHNTLNISLQGRT